MTVNLRRLAVGTESIETLSAFQTKRLENSPDGKLYTFTRMVPRRANELKGGSLYWIIKGYMRVRQEIYDVIEDVDEEGRRFCKLHLSPDLIPTELVPQKPFQGWRYFNMEDVPNDLKSGSKESGEIPDEMAAELREMGLL
ncbi:MAG: DUF1489 domain-containing protein [Rhodospirillales bacterium]|nr:DUF1489 domain-containing protein [Rhodospirillales bacterium]